jgi:hypothetical protein
MSNKKSFWQKKSFDLTRKIFVVSENWLYQLTSAIDRVNAFKVDWTC